MNFNFYNDFIASAKFSSQNKLLDWPQLTRFLSWLLKLLFTFWEIKCYSDIISVNNSYPTEVLLLLAVIQISNFWNLYLIFIYVTHYTFLTN